MPLKYYAGKAQTGSETRAAELEKTGLGHALGVKLAPGTFNVALMEDPGLCKPEIVYGPFYLWVCEVATQSMVERDEPGFKGWIIRVSDEALPGYFVEVISPHHLRSALKIEKHPSFIVEIGLNCREQARK